jgi:hypothetical protein
MSNENWYGRDLDEGAMATDNRSLKEHVKSLLVKLLGSKQTINSTAAKEEGQTEELPPDIV